MGLKSKNYKAWRQCHTEKGKGKKGWQKDRAIAYAIIHGKTAYPCPLPHHQEHKIWHIGGKPMTVGIHQAAKLGPIPTEIVVEQGAPLNIEHNPNRNGCGHFQTLVGLYLQHITLEMDAICDDDFPTSQAEHKQAEQAYKEALAHRISCSECTPPMRPLAGTIPANGFVP